MMLESNVTIDSILLCEKAKKIGDRTCRGKYGVTFNQFIILLILLEKQVKEYENIRRMICISRSSLTQTIKIMERKGLVEAEKAVGDRRKILLKGTKKGKDVFKKARKLLDILLQKRFEGVSNEEFEQIKAGVKFMQELYKDAC